MTKGEERARRGAAWLDKKLGPTWFKKIRVTRLKMNQGGFYPTKVGSCGCVLAQLDASTKLPGGEGNYGQGVQKFVGDVSNWGGRVVALGFLAHGSEEYAELDEAWQKVIREKKQAAKVAA